MLLCLDIGNTHLFGGVFKNDAIQLRFRHMTTQGATSDQLGVFLKTVLRENDLDVSLITQIAICSVVPSMDYSLRSACIKYFNITPFILKAGVKTGLKIKAQDPREVGADRIANAIAAVELYPKKNIIVVDFGTATTLCAITADRAWLGGVITTGMSLSIEALQTGTAQLPSVEIKKPDKVVGRTTIENIQAGLYYGHLGMIREVIKRMSREVFCDTQPLVIATGGFSYLFESEQLFSAILPDLALEGLRIAYAKNHESQLHDLSA